MICIEEKTNFLKIIFQRDCFILALCIKWYRLSYLVSFILIKLLTERSLKRDDLYGLFISILYGGIIFARLWHVVLELLEHGSYGENIFAIWNGGLAIQGGLVGGFLGARLYCWLKQLDMGPISDTILYFLPIGIFLVRIGNFTNNEFAYQTPFGVPMSIFSAFTEGAVLWTILSLFCFLKPKLWDITYVFLGAYGLIRFLNDFLRKECIALLGLKYSQIFCLFCITVSGLYFLREKK